MMMREMTVRINNINIHLYYYNLTLFKNK